MALLAFTFGGSIAQNTRLGRSGTRSISQLAPFGPGV